MSKPIFMGALMGPMMLWMMHGMLSGETNMGFIALVIFVAAHFVVAGIAFGAALFAARLSPRVRAWAARLHRPSLTHVGAMIGSAALAAGIVHLYVHGGLS